mgnify:CR=1 FL=1
MDERYTKQGFSYIGVLNDHKDSDLTNRLESYVAVHFLPHKSVTVNYVDQDGKKLADSVKLKSSCLFIIICSFTPICINIMNYLITILRHSRSFNFMLIQMVNGRVNKRVLTAII